MTNEFNWSSNLNSATKNIQKQHDIKAVEEFGKYLERELLDNPQLLDEIKNHATRHNNALPMSK